MTSVAAVSRETITRVAGAARLDVFPLTYGRARIGVGRAHPALVGDLGYDDEW